MVAVQVHRHGAPPGGRSAPAGFRPEKTPGSHADGGQARKLASEGADRARARPARCWIMSRTESLIEDVTYDGQSGPVALSAGVRTAPPLAGLTMLPLTHRRSADQRRLGARQLVAALAQPQSSPTPSSSPAQRHLPVASALAVL